MSTAAPSTAGTGFSEIPVVDLGRWSGSSEERAALAEEVRRCCHEVGFFYAEGHRVEPAFVERWFGLLERFFALPEEQKAKIDKRRSPHFRGWERTGAELTNGRTDFREQLDVSSEHPPHPRDAQPPFLRLDGPNQWLDEAALPGFHAAVLEFFERMGELARRIMGIMAVGLGLPERTFDERFGERLHSLAKLISYPATPPGEAGVNEHNDAGFLTILLQHRVSGLQALSPDGRWIDVPPRPGAFVINTGEMLQEMTGKYVVAGTHRVIARQPRFSAAYFFGPDLRTELAPLPLDPAYAAAVAASERHRTAGFMARKEDLEAGARGRSRAEGTGVYGQQLWNYYARSYPENMRLHHADLMSSPRAAAAPPGGVSGRARPA